MNEAVLDTSAVLAVVHGEVGQAEAGAFFDRAAISVVNVAEVVTNLADRGLSDGDARAMVAGLRLEIVPFNSQRAIATGLLRRATRHVGLSLGDRACISLAIEMDVPVVTADRLWAQLTLPVDVVLIR